jgi:hypothetical protein
VRAFRYSYGFSRGVPHFPSASSCAGPTLAFSRGVVHRDVEVPEPCDGLVDHSANIILLPDVGIDEFGLRTERAELVDELLACLVAPTSDNNLRAFFGEGDGGSASNADQSTCYQNNLSARGSSPPGYASLAAEA